MTESSLQGYEGPRPPRVEERDAVGEMLRTIFFPNARDYRDGAAAWPMAMHPEFATGVLAMFHRGQPVSAIARLERDIVVRGHALRLGYIGGVGTHPDHRGRGLASAILRASFGVLREHGVDFVYISGTRPMYYGAGADHIGGFSTFTVRRGEYRSDVPVELRAATTADVPLLCRLNERDATRFVRTPEDYEVIVTHGYCAGRPARFHLVTVGGVAVGYLFVSPTGEGENAGYHVMEVRGERFAAAAALSELAASLDGTGGVVVDVPWGDALGDVLRAQGVPASPGRTWGTVKVLDFCRTMARLRPYFASHVGRELADALRFLDAGGRYLALAPDGALTLEGETTMLQVLLGPPAGQELRGVAATGPFPRLLEACLPLALPSVYLNMI